MKKGQIEIGETIAVLFIFFILVVFGLIFYTKIQKGTVADKIEENMALKAIEVAQKAAFLPELRCSAKNVPVLDCVDLLKIEAFGDAVTANPIFYYDMFQFAEITIEQVFPEPETGIFLGPGSNPVSATLYARIPDGWTIRESTVIPTSIYDPKLGQYYFGLMQVYLYK
ncbi:MAG: hypothetical protein ABH879_04610 [archaeon]